MPPTATDPPATTPHPAGGRTLYLRGLTRREVRAMLADGLNPAALPVHLAEQAMERVFDWVLSPAEIAWLDDQVNAEAVAVFRHIMDLTYGGAAAEKN